jgi:hypothetical protein
MYGIVNKAICEMMLAKTSKEVWREVLAAAGLDDDAFIISASYDDQVTFALAAASSQALGISLDEFLHELGHWWIRQTAMRDYQHLMTAAGTTLRAFLLKLPDLHTRIGIIFPALKPPEFECTDCLPSSLRLHYRSCRQGLVPFVVGLLEALAIHFKTPSRITHQTSETDAPGHAVFLIEWSESQLSTS